MLSSLSALENPLWHRVAGLRPHLRAHVRVQRRRSAGEVWYLLIDPNTGRFHRLNRSAYEWAGRLDGRHDVETLWRHVHEQLGEAAPTQADVMRMLAQLSESELITVDALPELELLLRHKRQVEQHRKLAVANPLSFKVPLFDPSTVLNAVLPFVRPIFTSWGLVVWAALVTAALAAAVSHAPALRHALGSQTGTPAFLLTVWLAYPFVKLLHEFGHAFAVRVWGGEVREIGINLMLLTPVPYVDASAATQFAQRRRRMLVGAAGIMVELAMAALALFAWLATTTPWLQQLTLAVMVLCTLSTVLFNGNPLARFDGYYVLSDALEIPNLAARADEVARRWMRRLLGSRESASGSGEAARTRVWLAAYAGLSLAYRWTVGVAVVTWLYTSYAALALLGAAMLAFSLVLRPAWQALVFLLLDARLTGRRRRAVWLAGGMVVSLAAALAWVPMPSATVQRGVVWPADEAILRAETDGVLRTLHVEHGAHITFGTAVATLENLELEGERASAAAHRAQASVQYFRALAEDPARAQRLEAQRNALDTQLARLNERAAALQIRAKVAGTLVLPRASAQEGHFFPQGRELGYVLGDGAMLVKVALTESQAALLRRQATSVSVRLAQAPQEVLAAQVERVTPAATQTLPTPALGSAHGGPIATDPTDAAGRRTLEPVTLVDVRVPAYRSEHLGMSAWVRFEHAPEPLLYQWSRAVRQLFLRSLGGDA